MDKPALALSGEEGREATWVILNFYEVKGESQLRRWT